MMGMMPAPHPQALGPMVGRGRGTPMNGSKRNDYCQHFVDTGQRPQNFIRDVHLADLYAEYPKLKDLIDRKDKLVVERATPPMYMQCDLRTTELSPRTLGTKFDVILVDPPWEEYERRAPGMGNGPSWTWQEIMNLKVEDVADSPCFVLLWCGSQEGLDAGRHILRKWGFRRCEDICWLKTNCKGSGQSGYIDRSSVLQHTKEHCLMGIKGTVRRALDGHVIHSNIDTDIIISDEPPHGSTTKPEELYRIIERFCLGRRRLELFGEDHNIRPGWVTLGSSLTSSNFNKQQYADTFRPTEPLGAGPRPGIPPVRAPWLLGSAAPLPPYTRPLLQ